MFFVLVINVCAQTNYDMKLLIATDKNQKDSVLYYLSKGGNVNALTVDGVTPLMYASENGNIEICKILLDNGADANIQPKVGANALIVAAQYHHNEIVELLILNKAKFNLKDDLDYNALCYAVAYGYYDIAETLLFYGASHKMKCNNSDPMMIAAYYGDTLMIKILLNYGADVNSKDDEGFTPLMISAQNNFLDAVKYLAENGANLNDVNNLQHTALAIAVINNNFEITDYLILKDADYNKPDKQNLTSYTIAILNENKEIKRDLKKFAAITPTYLIADKVVFSFLNNFNNQDYMLGFDFGLHEARLNLYLFSGILFRPFYKNVIFQENENLYYQIKEQRTNVFLGIEKDFNIFTFSDFYRIGFLLGFKGIYSYGEYKSFYKKIEDNLLYALFTGFYYKGKHTGIKVNYEYLNMVGINTSPHRINISLNLFFSTIRIKHINKVLYWF